MLYVISFICICSATVAALALIEIKALSGKTEAMRMMLQENAISCAKLLIKQTEMQERFVKTDDIDAAGMAEKAFTDGVSNILNFSVGGKGGET